MATTEVKLLAVYNSPVVPLADVCEPYLGMNVKVAYQRAALNRLPFPVFRLSESQKAPLVVDVADLARHIDAQRECAKRSWENSQV